MRRFRSIATAVGGALVLAGCTQANPRQSASDSTVVVVDNDPIDPESGYESSCMFQKQVAHPDGAALIREFLERDGRGDFLRSDDWFAGATDCPGHEPGPDSYLLIADQVVRTVPLNDSLMLGVILERRLGLVTPGARGLDQLQVSTVEETDTIRAIRTKYGWRIESPALRQHVLITSPRTVEVWRTSGDTLRALGYSKPMP